MSLSRPRRGRVLQAHLAGGTVPAADRSPLRPHPALQRRRHQNSPEEPRDPDGPPELRRARAPLAAVAARCARCFLPSFAARVSAAVLLGTDSRRVRTARGHAAGATGSLTGLQSAPSPVVCCFPSPAFGAPTSGSSPPSGAGAGGPRSGLWLPGLLLLRTSTRGLGDHGRSSALGEKRQPQTALQRSGRQAAARAGACRVCLPGLSPAVPTTEQPSYARSLRARCSAGRHQPRLQALALAGQPWEPPSPQGDSGAGHVRPI